MIDSACLRGVYEQNSTEIGRQFEDLALNYFYAMGIDLWGDFAVPLGVAARKKTHRFDLGSEDPAILVECKAHSWTAGAAMPSAKLTFWNEAMYYFHVAPRRYRKILFVLKQVRRGESLAACYLRIHGHLVPDDVKLWEFDAATRTGERLR